MGQYELLICGGILVLTAVLVMAAYFIHQRNKTHLPKR